MKEKKMNLTYDSKMFRETFESEFTWLEGFMRNVRRYSKKTAAIDAANDIKWTYEELNRASNLLANALRNGGVKKGDLILVQLYNSPQFLFGYIASHKIGAVFNPVNFNLSFGETAEIMDHNKPKVYIYDTDITETALKSLEKASHKPDIVIAVNGTDRASAIPEGHILYEDFVKGMSEQDPPADFEPYIYDETLRLQTSGTTSIPKGVPLNSVNEVLSAHGVIMDLALNRNDVTINISPWFHRGGIHTTGPTATLYCGGTVVIMRTFSPKICIKYIEKYGITFMTGVPAVLILLSKQLEQHPADISTLRGIMSMGSPLEKEVCIRFQNQLTKNIFNGYGTTETLWNVVLTPDDLPEMSGYAGRSSVDDDVRVVRVYDDKKAEPDETVADDESEEGEIIIKSPAKSSYCYADNEKTTKEKFYKGWLYTGDIGVWNEQKYIKVMGRKDDMIISKGENIYPVRIEEVLSCHPKVEDCIVVGVPEATRGESVAAYIVASDDSLTASELKEYCEKSSDISRYQAPRYYRFVEELPRTATGKKQHYVIRNQAKDDLSKGLLEKV